MSRLCLVVVNIGIRANIFRQGSLPMQIERFFLEQDVSDTQDKHDFVTKLTGKKAKQPKCSQDNLVPQMPHNYTIDLVSLLVRNSSCSYLAPYREWLCILPPP